MGWMADVKDVFNNKRLIKYLDDENHCTANLEFSTAFALHLRTPVCHGTVLGHIYVLEEKNNKCANLWSVIVENLCKKGILISQDLCLLYWHAASFTGGNLQAMWWRQWVASECTCNPDFIKCCTFLKVMWPRCWCHLRSSFSPAGDKFIFPSETTGIAVQISSAHGDFWPMDTGSLHWMLIGATTFPLLLELPLTPLNVNPSSHMITDSPLYAFNSLEMLRR